jgi:CheY-like chemotaxis protein
VLKKEGYDTVAVESGALAFKALEKQEFDLVMTDLKMQQVDGLQVLERTKELSPDTEVIMITGFATVSTAVEAMQKGAYHYLPKPYKIDEMRILVAKAMEKRSLRQEVTELKRQVQSQKIVPFLVGKSPKIELLKQTIDQIAQDATVLILGKPAPARNWWPRPSTTSAPGPTTASWPSTAGPSAKSCWPTSSSATNEKPSPGPGESRRACWKRLRGARSS